MIGKHWPSTLDMEQMATGGYTYVFLKAAEQEKIMWPDVKGLEWPAIMFA